jgi:SPP1 family predicted phage head-tail adaptor
MACTCQDFAAKANRRVLLQQNAVTQDSMGDSVEAWTTLATVWAMIEPKASRENTEQRQLQGKVMHKVTIRYRADMMPVQTGVRRRVVYGSRTFNIQGVLNPNEANEFLELTCEEGGAV